MYSTAMHTQQMIDKAEYIAYRAHKPGCSRTTIRRNQQYTAEIALLSTLYRSPTGLVSERIGEWVFIVVR